MEKGVATTSEVGYNASPLGAIPGRWNFAAQQCVPLSEPAIELDQQLNLNLYAVRTVPTRQEEA
jgi:hypothetical protein